MFPSDMSSPCHLPVRYLLSWWTDLGSFGPLLVQGFPLRYFPVTLFWSRMEGLVETEDEDGDR